MYITIIIATGNLLREKKRYNVTVPVTMVKYLLFSVGKTAHI